MAALAQLATPAAVLLAGSGRVTGGDLSVTSLVMAVAAASAVMPAVLAVEEFVSVLDSALAAARAVAEITEAQPVISQPDHPRTLLRERSDENHEGIIPPGVELENVTFEYPRMADEPVPSGTPSKGGSHEESDVVTSPVLKDVSLTIEPGESVALVGASGSGKSTIGAMIARVWDPQAGSVRLGGIDVHELAEAELRRAVTLVPQRPFLFSGTLRENLLLANPEASEEELLEACRLAALATDSVTLPNGLDTAVREFGGGVSGGQRQRIALARALLRGTPILVLDEVTSDLDSDTEREVAEHLRLLAPERTLVFIAHRPTTALLADRVIVIDDGRVIESGTPAALLEAGGAFSVLMERDG